MLSILCIGFGMRKGFFLGEGNGFNFQFFVLDSSFIIFFVFLTANDLSILCIGFDSNSAYLGTNENKLSILCIGFEIE